MKKELLSFLIVLLLTPNFVSAQPEINGEMKILQALPGINPQGMSSDGKYATGYIIQSLGYIWSEEEGFTYLGDINSSAYDVSTNGIVAGSALHPTLKYDVIDENGVVVDRKPLETAAYFKNGEWIFFDVRNDIPIDETAGNTASAISDDGTLVAGALKVPSDGYHTVNPVCWNINDGTVTMLDLGRGEYGRATRMSGDGSVIGGWIQHPYVGRTAVLWINGELKYISFNGAIHTSEISAISANGKYATLTSLGKAALYDIENDKLTFIPVPSFYQKPLPLTVSNDGTVGGQVSQEMGMMTSDIAFIYSRELGFMTLINYLNQQGIDREGLQRIERVTKLSADGSRLYGRGFGDGSLSIWMLDIYSPLFAYNTPQDLKASLDKGPKTVSLSWQGVEEEQGHVFKGYNIYRNDVKINTNLVLETTYEDTSLENGQYVYQVKAVWDEDKESTATNSASVNVGELSLPFYDGFDKGNLTENFWNVQYQETSRWSVIGGGLMEPCMGYDIPMGEYSDYITTPYLDGTNFSELYLSFNLGPVAENNIPANNLLTIEVSAGDEWKVLKTYEGKNYPNFTPEKINISDPAAQKKFRVRFKMHGNNDISGFTRWYIDNVRVYAPEDDIKRDAPLHANAVRNEEDGKVSIMWSDPNETAILGYVGAENVEFKDQLGNQGEPFIAAVKYDAGDLKSYDGYKMTSISAYLINMVDGDEVECNIVAFKGDEKILEQKIPYYSPSQWNTFYLDDPITIDASQPLYFGIEVTKHHENNRVVSLYPMPELDGKSNLYSNDGGKTWKSLAKEEPAIHSSIAVKANISKDDNTPRQGIMGYIIYRDGQLILEAGRIHPAHTFIDHYAPKEPCCYEVAAYYYIPQDYSEATEKVCVSGWASGIEDNTNNNINVYPSIVTDYINIEGEFTNITLSNVNGHTITNTFDNKIDMQNLPTGLYILQVDTPKGKVIKKVLKQ